MPAEEAPKGEQGFLLIFLMMGVAVMLIMLTVAGQSWTFQMRREMELELVFRGEQYINGLTAFRKANGNAFPVGDLKVLAQKNQAGIRFMRKLYKNPLDPNGRWQYLYLHPGGTGFINPCAVGGGVGFNDPTVGQGFGGGRALGRGGSGGASLDRGGAFNPRIMGTRPANDEDDSEEEGRGLPTGAARSGLSAMDPKTFKDVGIQKMNLPIVGVVNCQMVESIRTYKGQSWLSNWAFTPLAQGEFGGNAQAGGGAGSTAGLTGGIGQSGNEVFTNPSRQRFDQRLNAEDPWRRQQHGPPSPDGQNDPNRPPDPHQPSDPNHPSDPNQIQGDPNNPDGIDGDSGDDGSGDEDEGDDEGDEGDEDPNTPPDPNAPSTQDAGGSGFLS